MELIFKKTGAQPIENLIKERRLRYLGHIMRYPQERLVKQIVGATAKESSRAKNLGWTKTMASELKNYEIKVEDMQDKDTLLGGK